LHTSKFILGTAQFGLDYGINNSTGKAKEEDVFSILDFSLANGINHIDTASAYGNAEEVLGRYFKIRGDYDKFEITTKFSFAKGINLTECLHDSLNNLNVNAVDTVLFHSYSDYKNYQNQLSEFIDINKNKYFKHIGVSVYTNEEIEGLIDDANIDIVQTPYNLLDNNNLRGRSFSQLKTKGKKIHVRSVFLQGLFFKKSDHFPINLISLKKSVQELNELCVEYSLDMRQLALSYVIKNILIDGVLIGVDSLAQLKENITSIKKDLSDEIINRIESIIVPNKELLNPSKWGILK
jgi:aryl-alcohol dehydrogenase-like predicted oxidoreductase